MKRIVKATVYDRTTGDQAEIQITVETTTAIDELGEKIFDESKGKLMSVLNPSYRSVGPFANLGISTMTDA